MALGKQKKPAGNDHSERYLHLSAILGALQRLEKLICTNPTLGTELKECRHSRNTLTSLSKLLITQDYDKYIREMARRHLDWRNPLGQDTYECFRYVCTMEKNMLEAARDNGGFSTPQSSPPPSLSTGVCNTLLHGREYLQITGRINPLQNPSRTDVYFYGSLEM